MKNQLYTRSFLLRFLFLFVFCTTVVIGSAQNKSSDSLNIFMLYDVSGSMRSDISKYEDSCISLIWDSLTVTQNRPEAYFIGFGNNTKSHKIIEKKDSIYKKIFTIKKNEIVSDILSGLIKVDSILGTTTSSSLLFLITDGRLNYPLDYPIAYRNDSANYLKKIKLYADSIKSKTKLLTIQIRQKSKSPFLYNVVDSNKIYYLKLDYNLNAEGVKPMQMQPSDTNYVKLRNFIYRALLSLDDYEGQDIFTERKDTTVIDSLKIDSNANRTDVPISLGRPIETKTLTLNDMSQFITNPTPVLFDNIIRERVMMALKYNVETGTIDRNKITQSQQDFKALLDSSKTYLGNQLLWQNIDSTLSQIFLEKGYALNENFTLARPLKTNINTGNLTVTETVNKIAASAALVEDQKQHDYFRLNSTVFYSAFTNQLTPAYSLSVNLKDAIRNPKQLVDITSRLDINENTMHYVKDYYQRVDSILNNASLFSFGLSVLDTNSINNYKESMYDKLKKLQNTLNLSDTAEGFKKLLDHYLSIYQNKMNTKIDGTKKRWDSSINSFKKVIGDKSKSVEEKVRKIFDDTVLTENDKELFFLISIEHITAIVYKNLDALKVFLATVVISEKKWSETPNKFVTLYDSILTNFLSRSDSTTNKVFNSFFQDTGQFNAAIKKFKEIFYRQYYSVLNENLMDILKSAGAFIQVKDFVENKLPKLRFLQYFSVTAFRAVDTKSSGEWGYGISLNPTFFWRLANPKQKYYRDFPLTITAGIYTNGVNNNWKFAMGLSFNTFISNLLQKNLSSFNPELKTSR